MSKAVILAAGQGSRLRPMTDDKPKCLVPLAGISLLERQAATLRQAGISEINVATGYRSDCIEKLGFGTSFNPRFAETNMVESLFAASDFFPQDRSDLIIGYGDIVYQLDNLNALLACRDEIALMIDTNWRALWSLRQEDPLQDAETLVMDANDFVTELGQKPDGFERIQGQYTGLIKIAGRKVGDLISFYRDMDRSGHYDGKNFDNMYMTSFLQRLIDSGWKAKAVKVVSGWLEIDSVSDLECYDRMAEAGKLDPFYRLDPG